MINLSLSAIIKRKRIKMSQTSGPSDQESPEVPTGPLTAKFQGLQHSTGPVLESLTSSGSCIALEREVYWIVLIFVDPRLFMN